MSSEAWVLVTGANRGLGYATARSLVKAGESVIVGARSRAAGDEAVTKLGKETGHPERLATLVVDTSKPESIDAAAAKLEAEYAGRLGGLVSNAGVTTGERSEAEYNRLWETNVVGTFLISKRLAPLMNKGGHIVHLGSALGQLDALPLAQYKESIRDAKSIQELMDLRYPADEIAKCPLDSNDVHSVLLLYCLSKAAVLFGVRLQADEPYMKPRGVSVVAVCPGWCQTDLGTSAAPRSVEDGAKVITWAYRSSKARASHGGFFQDNRPLSIVESYPDKLGPLNMVAEE